MEQQGAAGSPWTEMLAAVSTVQQEAIDRLEVPLLILDVPGRRIRAANDAVAALFDRPAAELIGLRNDEAVQFDDVEGMQMAVDALSSGAIDGYRARRRVTTKKGVTRDVLTWARLFDVGRRRYAAYLISPLSPKPDGPPVTPPWAWVGPVVLGRAERDWRITCISTDVRELLGNDPADYLDRSLLDFMHQDDVDALRVAMPASRNSSGVITMRQLRLQHHDGRWQPVQCLFACLDAKHPLDIAFTLFPAPMPPPTPDSDRVAEMEHRLRRIAAELRAVGMMDGIDTLPSAAEFPQLTRLSSRQWQILVRLLRGERVPAMARELHVSQSTLRNHLSDMFERFGVHSQAELIALLRRR